jgi:hypothetical protein
MNTVFSLYSEGVVVMAEQRVLSWLYRKTI